jgi:ElaB/YqjD/DUF883 family membrane-anchored ribosome-binding protein
MSARLEQAKIEAERARKRFTGTLDAVQERLKPASLADQAWTGVKDKGSDIADGAVEAVKARPVAAAGVAAAFLLYLARRPIISRASRLWSKRHKNGVQNGVQNGVDAPDEASGVEE